jgi:indole-3-glycerol phosphate synthase
VVAVRSRLKEIVAEKQREIIRLKRGDVPLDRDKDSSPRRDFKGAVSVPGRVGLVAEIKFASPSAGIIREKMDPVSIGRIYEKNGARAISLVTDRLFFKGDLNQLPRLKKALSLPVLRKDFFIDPIQVRESFLHGADAVLLIARLLTSQQLKEMLAACRECGVAPLTEIHDIHDLEKAVECGARIIGINNRDLDTFKVDTKTTLDLAPLVPESCVLISESGITTGKDIRRLKGRGIDAVLVGTALMKSNNIAAKTRELVEAGREHGKG